MESINFKKIQFNDLFFNKNSFKVLQEINNNPGISLTQLSENIELSIALTCQYLRKLEKNNLITKMTKFDNLKVNRLHPTKQGKDLYNDILVMILNHKINQYSK